ncbi:MAG: hypothetical protein AB1592_15180 [Pseudomonadota bacterium]
MSELSPSLPHAESATGARSPEGQIPYKRIHSAPSASRHAAHAAAGARAVRAPFDPGYSFLRASLAVRLGIVALCIGVLWVAVLAVTA